jgi:D-alanyl-D-alanine carboxypeptidase (penicillin-binding protein 5/6)
LGIFGKNNLLILANTFCMNKKKICAAVLTAVGMLGLMGAAGKICGICGCPECGKGTITYAAENTAESGTPKVTAKAAFLMEANSGEVLFTKDENKRLPIASMTKVATLGVVYDALANGEINMDDMVTVSENAGGMGGSQAFLDMNSEYSVADLIKSIVVASANDSCVAMAEKLYGSTTEFVNKMNGLAKRLGCENTNFVNCTGLPAVGAYSSAADIAKLYRYIMKSPYYADFNKVWMYDLTHPSGRITGLTNTNKLARFYNGCDGGKTGYTTEAGHCITVAATRGDLKPIAVIIGAGDSKTRFAEASNLMNYTFDSFENKLLVDKFTPITDVKVRGAVNNTATLFPAENFYKLSKKGNQNAYEINFEIPDKLTAPIAQTDAVGKAIVTENGKVLKEIPVVTNGDIDRATYLETVRKVVSNARL